MAEVSYDALDQTTTVLGDAMHANGREIARHLRNASRASHARGEIVRRMSRLESEPNLRELIRLTRLC